MNFTRNFDETHKRLLWQHGKFSSATDLKPYHDKLFWNNSEKDVFQLIESLEWKIFEQQAVASDASYSEMFKTQLKRIWKIYATEATCVAPPWRNCVARTEIAEKETTKVFKSILLLLEDVPQPISKEEVELIENYVKDFHFRFLNAAKKNDHKFNSAAAVGTAVLGLAAAAAVASRRN